MISLIISLFLDGLLSVYEKVLHIRPMFSIVILSILFIRNYNNISFYYKICLFAGFIYDLLYTSTFPLNSLVFLLLGFIISKLYQIFKNNLLTGVLINIFILLIYRSITFIVLSIIGYLPFSFNLFIDDILSIVLTNTVFFLFVYIIFKDNKRKITKYGL